jgi:hypothetical protein
MHCIRYACRMQCIRYACLQYTTSACLLLLHPARVLHAAFLGQPEPKNGFCNKHLRANFKPCVHSINASLAPPNTESPAEPDPLPDSTPTHKLMALSPLLLSAVCAGLSIYLDWGQSLEKERGKPDQEGDSSIATGTHSNATCCRTAGVGSVCLCSSSI